MDPLDAVKLLLDTKRLAVAGALAVEPGDAASVAERTGLRTRDVLDAIGMLRSAGIVAATDNVYRLDTQGMREVAQQLAKTATPMDPFIGYGMTDEEQVILSRFFEGRTLVEFPTSKAKRRVLLERLALEFEIGERYTEKQVNEILGQFNPDWSTLRRYLVDEELLNRGDGEYWRIGGTVILD